MITLSQDPCPRRPGPGRPASPRLRRAALALLLLSGSGCAGAPEGGREGVPVAPVQVAQEAGRHEYSRPAMGVHARIVLHTPDRAHAEAAARAAFEEIARLERLLSDYDETSELRRLEERLQVGVWTELSPAMLEAWTIAVRLATETSLVCDPTLGAVTRRWREARAAGAPLSEQEIASLRSATGLTLIDLDRGRGRLRVRAPGVRFDFGGIGKGLAADAALRVLRARGCPAALVDVGGDIACGEPPPGRDGWVIGLDRGAGEEEVRVTIARCGIATSGDREQGLEVDGVRLSHIVDPNSRQPLRDAPQLTVLAPDAARADAWATALSVRPDLAAGIRGRPGYRVWVEGE